MKAGIRTTEFWLTILATLLNFAVSGGFIAADFPQAELVTGVGSIAAVVAYIISRGILKRGNGA